jgi:hypothetical protein
MSGSGATLIICAALSGIELSYDALPPIGILFKKSVYSGIVVIAFFMQ